MPDAIISALGTIAAAFVGVVTWYLASRHDRQRELSEREAQRQAEERLRDQRVLDIVVALHSEILAGIVANRRQLTKEDAEYAMAQETPFATADDTDFVFDSVKDDLSILPAEVIHSVVQYYRTAKQSNLLTADLRDPYFLRQTPSEKRRIIGHLLQIVETQKILGEAALSDLSAFAGKQGLDLRENETRAGKLLLQAREEMKLIFKKSERSARTLKPPEKRKRKLS
jgi:hypothetical protein